MNDNTHSLSAIELFDGLEGSERDALARSCRWHRYSAEQYIIGHQDETNDVYFIVSGRVRVTVFSASGKEVSFADLPAGKSFGEMSAIDDAPRSATVIALSDTVLASMSAGTFLKILDDHPDVTARMMQHLVSLIRRLTGRVFEFSVMAVRNRIHAELLRLARDQEPDTKTAIITPVPTHADIASRVSTHREAVTRELNVLTRDGLIERGDGGLVIKDVGRLAQLVETGLQE